MDLDFDGKAALVTGVSSVQGIGFDIARQLLANGADVTISGRTAEAGAKVLDALGAGAHFFKADLAQPEEVQALAARVGDVDVLVNNAAHSEVKPALEQDLQGFDSSFAVNVRAPYFLVSQLAPGMLRRGGGSIVNVTSISAGISAPERSVYGATQGALESLTRYWAAEFAPSVRVNSVAPGTTESERALNELSEADVVQISAGTPLGRMGDPSEIAEAVVFLASSRASFITGSTITVDGGRTAV